MNLDIYIELLHRMMPVIAVYVGLIAMATYAFLDMKD
jgi:hypothetical protein